MGNDDWRDDEPEARQPTPLELAAEQGAEAVDELERDASEYLRFPWPELRDLINGGVPDGDGMAPGFVTFLCGFSGMGKSMLVYSLLLEWLNAGKAIYLLPLETKPSIVWAHLACRELGLIPGAMLAGFYKGKPEGAQLREKLAEITRRWAGNLIMPRLDYLDPESLKRAGNEALDMDIDVMVVDHIDHVRGSRPGQPKLAVLERTLEVAHDLQKAGLRQFHTSQMNQEAVRRDRLALYRAPQPNDVWMGTQKRFIADVMLGLFRPLRRDISKEEMKAAREGSVPLDQITQPGRACVSLMKDRRYGRDGKIAMLAVRSGQVCSLSENPSWQ